MSYNLVNINEYIEKIYLRLSKENFFLLFQFTNKNKKRKLSFLLLEKYICITCQIMIAYDH